MKCTFSHIDKVKSLELSLAMVMFCALPVCSENKFLQQGISEHNSGNYMEAVGHLGAALSSDFNNATLHYYMASCFVHLNQNEAAIREFRIAHALEPNGKVGLYSRQALSYLKADSAGSEIDSKSKNLSLNGKPILKPPSVFDKTVSLLRRQVEHDKSFQIAGSHRWASELTRRQDESISRTIADMLNTLHPFAKLHANQPLPLEVRNEVNRLTQNYESRRNRCLQHGINQASELDKTAQNLQDLLSQKAKPGKMQLVPAGTNLYIRNYAIPAPDNKESNSPQLNLPKQKSH